MDSIGDYIYLIILALAGISGLFKKKKETTTSTATPKTNPTSTKKSWEDVLRDLIPIEEEEIYKTQEVTPQAVNQAPEPFLNYEANIERAKPIERKQPTRFVNTFAAKEKLEDKKNEETNNAFLAQIQLSSIDDAKRAFVYSEIFNRK